jgi:hypothetical protein
LKRKFIKLKIHYHSWSIINSSSIQNLYHIPYPYGLEKEKRKERNKQIVGNTIKLWRNSRMKKNNTIYQILSSTRIKKKINWRWGVEREVVCGCYVSTKVIRLLSHLGYFMLESLFIGLIGLIIKWAYYKFFITSCLFSKETYFLFLISIEINNYITKKKILFIY